MIRRKTTVKRGQKISKYFKTYLFQGHSVRPKHWFNLDLEWFEDIFVTREPQFFKEAVSTQY